MYLCFFYICTYIYTYVYIFTYNIFIYTYICIFTYIYIYIFIVPRFLIDEAIPVPFHILMCNFQPADHPRNGWTPLMWAAIVGNSQVTDLLIQATCDIFAKDVTWLKMLGRILEDDTFCMDYQRDFSTAEVYNWLENFIT